MLDQLSTFLVVAGCKRVQRRIHHSNELRSLGFEFVRKRAFIALVDSSLVLSPKSIDALAILEDRAARRLGNIGVVAHQRNQGLFEIFSLARNHLGKPGFRQEVVLVAGAHRRVGGAGAAITDRTNGCDRHGQQRNSRENTGLYAEGKLHCWYSTIVDDLNSREPASIANITP